MGVFGVQRGDSFDRVAEIAEERSIAAMRRDEALRFTGEFIQIMARPDDNGWQGVARG
jgi:hypothetical protein